MIKTLFYIASLLLPGLAYGGSPNADLSIQVVPPQSGPPVPAPAQAAGFTTLALNADFTTPTYSNTGTYINECGASSGWRWFLFYSGAGHPNQVSCGKASITTDPTYGGQVLDLQYLPSDLQAGINAGGNGNYIELQWPVGYHASSDAIGPTLPNEMYTEITFRTTSQSFSQANATIPLDYWATSWCACEFELDFFEVNTGFGYSNGWYYNSAFGNARLDFSQYHTLGILFTSNESSSLEQCMYVDGSLVNCGSVSGLSSTNYTQHDNTLNILFGGGLCFNNATPCVANAEDYYIKSITLWECTNYKTQGCPGPVINQ